MGVSMVRTVGDKALKFSDWTSFHRNMGRYSLLNELGYSSTELFFITEGRKKGITIRDS